MGTETALDLIRQVLVTALWIGLPILAAGLVVGVVVSLGQIVTSIQDPAVGTIPRLVTLLAAVSLCLPWMANQLIRYTHNLWSDFSRYVR
jgi:flagellar biosynthetic protein FliQ